jgi:hypothetical protein
MNETFRGIPEVHKPGGQPATVSHEEMQRREAEYRKQVDENPTSPRSEAWQPKAEGSHAAFRSLTP